jgi:cytochrome b subunit of formate dehydrogenase
MKVFAFLVSFVLFVGGILMFGYAFAAGPEWHTLVFSGGIAAISLSLIIPFHLLERLD